MTATATTVLSAPRTSVRPLVRAGLLATVLASIATTVVAAVGQEAGISLDISGEAIPLFAFAQLTALFSLVGVGLAAVLARRNRAPRRTFVVTTVALTVLSLVPDVLADAAWDTRVLLMATHLVAAAIVVPALAARLPE
ncbi:DUF6069 family protein [Sporichthya polymorpha]|uniref:DUF6069 family protein n=1 Tax=Sporichthya polymorpha TaxID=35751 RepID=UPI00036E79DA|nr:DUF6069 family protein [Sporichthya polymorpha]